MGTVTGWALRTWLKLTVLLALVIGGLWLWLPTGSGWFWVAIATACVVEWWITRQLAREWAWEARMTWWWSR